MARKTILNKYILINAKRFEAQAKEIRGERGRFLFPVIVMNKGLKEHAVNSTVFNTQTFQY